MGATVQRGWRLLRGHPPGHGSLVAQLQFQALADYSQVGQVQTLRRRVFLWEDLSCSLRAGA